MKTINSLFITILTLTLLTNCSPKQEVKVKVQPNCGDLLEFESTRDYCNFMDLPVSLFTVNYPEALTQVLPVEGTLNIDYNYFKLLDSTGTQTEAIALGSSTMYKNSPLKKMLYQQILIQAQQVANRQQFKLRDEFMGIEIFDGQEYNIYRAIGDIDSKVEGLHGTYLILCLIVEANVNNRNGVFVTMVANENSIIESYDDFADKGCISKVWQSIRFNYLEEERK